MASTKGHDGNMLEDCNKQLREKERRIAVLSAEVRELREKLSFFQNGLVANVYHILLDTFELILPRDKFPGSQIRKIFSTLKKQIIARRLQEKDVDFSFLHPDKQRNFPFPFRPFFSIFIICEDDDTKNIPHLLRAIFEQTYTDFEIIILASEVSVSQLEELQNKYDLIQQNKIDVIKMPDEKDFIMQFFCQAQSDYCVFISEEVRLLPAALFELAITINKDKADIIYGDEAIGSIWDKHLWKKPDFAPDTFISKDYLSGFIALRNMLFRGDEASGIFSEGYWFCELLLHYLPKTSKIEHIRKVISIREQSANVERKRNQARIISLQQYFDKQKIEARVFQGLVAGAQRVEFEIIDNPKVSIIIPFKDQFNYLEQCVQSILAKSSYQNYEILCVDNESDATAMFLFKKKVSDRRIRFLSMPGEFNFSLINNRAANHADGTYIIFLNNDTEVISEDWIEQMLMLAQQEKVGAVGAKLLYPDGSIQHAGLVIPKGEYASHIYKFAPSTNSGYMDELHYVRNVIGVTAACMMVRKKTFDSLAGFDTKMAIAGNDVDLCIRLWVSGYRNIFTPFATLYHHESISRGYDTGYDKKKRFKKELAYFFKKHRSFLKTGDPYFRG